MKSARFEKASEEIGVPRGKKSERYRSTAHGQTDRRQFIQVQSLAATQAAAVRYGRRWIGQSLWAGEHRRNMALREAANFTASANGP